MKQSVFLAPLLAFLLAACLAGCGGMSWGAAEKAMDHSLATGDTDRALKIGLDYLKADADTPEAYQKLADLYTDTLGDQASALAILKQGSEATGDEELLSRYIEGQVKNSGLLEGLAQKLPKGEELTLEGVPFSQWTADQLWAWLPAAENSYEDTGEGEHRYRSESFKNGSVTIQSNSYSGGSSLEVDFRDLGRYANSYGKDGPEPTLPRNIRVGDTPASVLGKLGLSEQLTDILKEYSSISLYVQENSADLYVNQYGDDSFCNISINYDNRSYYGSVGFSFYQGGLNGYSIHTQS